MRYPFDFARGIAHAFGRAFEAVMRFFGADTTTITHWKNIITAAFDLSEHWQKFKSKSKAGPDASLGQ
ncbi:hypothetical protein HNQ74_000572 [Bartonella doshiae]|uniref:Uncharacterized protein n=2 Tax=Bartonella doshiae TaxID=33044 RepID=A0A380ZG20_BARDO|nr:hypothetical protein [Bartonella doshiae]EJF81136.1 hypothetical protein MCS_00849 [Bartonella doshiae NCTC 12862 = ATCC 700133]MBB6159154.1 hypothetical protein [Bartonella doshiae]SUV45284.1 Uncharacterised protein [Bartonella doshiae]